MNAVFKKRQGSFLLGLLLFAIVLFAVHSYILHYFVHAVFFFPLWQIYVFHCFVTIVIYTIINYRHANGNEQIFTVFMGSTLAKMIIALIFLLPLILSDLEDKRPDVFNFFIPYFLFLAFEIYFITDLLKNPS